MQRPDLPSIREVERAYAELATTATEVLVADAWVTAAKRAWDDRRQTLLAGTVPGANQAARDAWVHEQTAGERIYWEACEEDRRVASHRYALAQQRVEKLRMLVRLGEIGLRLLVLGAWAEDDFSDLFAERPAGTSTGLVNWGDAMFERDRYALCPIHGLQVRSDLPGQPCHICAMELALDESLFIEPGESDFYKAEHEEQGASDSTKQVYEDLLAGEQGDPPFDYAPEEFDVPDLGDPLPSG